LILDGRRLLITGVMTRRSIAYHVAEQAQLAGAEVILTSFGRVRRLTERAAQRLPSPPEVLELDVTRGEDFARLRDEVAQRWDVVDGALHAVAYAPADAFNGDFLATPAESAAATFTASAFSLKALAQSLEPLMRGSDGGASIVALDFDGSAAWPVYDWMGVSKSALAAIARYLACYLGPQGMRVNLVQSGPLATTAASAIPGFQALADRWAKAPLGWDCDDPLPPARAACFLLSNWSRGISGEILRVDGGFRAAGTPFDEIDMWVERPESARR
jgi:enoyl-[acyl-carrier protein] reductase I